MADGSTRSPATEKKRPWWALARLQGVALMAAGVGMCFHPATLPHAGTVIAVGAGWAGGGTASHIARKLLQKMR